MTNKKILFLVTSYHTINFFKKIIKGLISQGHSVRILALQELPFGAKEDGWDTHRCDWHMFDFRKIESFNPDRVVVFNGYFRTMHAAVKTLRATYPTFFAEVGWFPQNDYIYLDTDIHHKSAIGQYDLDLDAPITDAQEELIKDLQEKYSPVDVTVPTTDPFVLTPLQLERDTSIIYASPFFKDMNSLMGKIKKDAGSLPLAIKPHPKMVTDERESTLTYKAADYVLDKSLSMNALASKAAIIAGINSTSLMEALIHLKPIAQYGYNVAQGESGKGPFLDMEYYSKSHAPIQQAYEDFEKGVARGYNVNAIKRTLLHLLANQIDFRAPPSWAAQKIVDYDTTCRTAEDI